MAKVDDRRKFIDPVELEALSLYALARALPKGVLLHAHLGAVVNMVEFFRYLSTNYPAIYANIYYVSNAAAILAYTRAFLPPLLAKDLYYNMPFEFDATRGTFKFDITNGLAYFPNGVPCAGYTQLLNARPDADTVVNLASRMQNVGEYNFDDFERYNILYKSVTKHVDVFPIYFEYALDAVAKDNLYGVELKSNIGALYEKSVLASAAAGASAAAASEAAASESAAASAAASASAAAAPGSYVTYTGQKYEQEEIDSMSAIIKKKKKETGFLCNIVSGQLRLTNKVATNVMTQQLTSKCKLALKPNNGIIQSIDLIGEESSSANGNAVFLNTLINNCNGLNYSIHSGESNAAEGHDMNLTTIVTLKEALNTKANQKIVRVGHGISLKNDQLLMNQYKELGIHVELCPISNYILGYVPNLAKHPGAQYIRQGLRVSINSDDPSMFNYDYVSYDWLFAIGLWRLTVDEIERVCLFSIEDSCFTAQEKQAMKARFAKDFTAWSSKYAPLLADYILLAQPVLQPFTQFKPTELAGGQRQRRKTVSRRRRYGQSSRRHMRRPLTRRQLGRQKMTQRRLRL
jgi:adenosine deaminase